MLDLDLSFLVILALVWILMILLDRIFFRPVGSLIRKRENMIEADTRRLGELHADIEAGTRKIEASLLQARQESLKIREDIISRGEAAREQNVSAARVRAREVMAREMDRLEKEIGAAEERLKERVGEFSARISEIFQ